MRVHSQDENGFSLIELMVVLAVFGILVAITAPAVSGLLRSTRLSGAATTLEADIRYAHSLAGAQRKTFQICFQGTQYSVVQVTPAATLLTRTMPTGMACSATDTATFYPWGLSDPITITVGDSAHSAVMQIAANGKVTRV
jgi:prepilin-type N-terminal cleavage/methylation domain-containing protein